MAAPVGGGVQLFTRFGGLSHGDPDEIRAALTVFAAVLEEGVRRDIEIKLNIIEHHPETIWARYDDSVEKLTCLGLECCRDLGLEPRNVEIKLDPTGSIISSTSFGTYGLVGIEAAVPRGCARSYRELAAGVSLRRRA